MTDEKLTVVVADDHAPTRSAVRAVLEEDGWAVVGEAATAAQAVELTAKLGPLVCLLDITMPGGGVAAARQITDEHPDVVVVMLTHSDDDADLFDSLKAGARGYLLKHMNPDRLGTALRGVLDGEAAVPRQLVARVLDEFRAQPRGRLRPKAAADPLTSREREIMELLRDGLTTTQVARELFISPGTVRVHVSSVLRKLRVDDRESALRRLDEAEN